MQPEQVLPIPLDIPWRLAATTTPRQSGDPFRSNSTISLFYYEPSTPTLADDYPDDRIIYLKAVVSICPAKLPEKILQIWIEPDVDLADHLVGMSGVWHALFDVSVTPDPDTNDLIHPYFHAVAPANREMVETGVIGNDQAQGSGNSVAVGKSGTQLHETISSTVGTQSSGKTFDAGIFAASTGSTSTTVDTDRTVHEVVDSTYREASQERRELLSHHTDISNVLSLLSATDVGSPYTRFSIWPRPISMLSLDPGDPNLWYMELLKRRSSGVEGIQEFVLVLVVPKNQNFCIAADLKRFFIADQPPTSPVTDRWFGYDVANDPDALELVTDYLFKRFPRGTPLDDLDYKVELDPKVFLRPVVGNWLIPPLTYPSHSAVRIAVVSTTKGSGIKWEYKPYKMVEEVYLDAVTAKYEEDLARSPLERGVIVMKSTKLDTCFEAGGGTPLSVISFSTQTGVGSDLAPTAGGQDAANADGTYETYALLTRGTQSPARRGRAVVARWNEAQRAFSRHVESTPDWAARSVDRTDPRMFDLLLSAVAGLATSDPRNLTVTALVQRLGLPESIVSRLRRSGVESFRDLARYLHASARPELPTVARHGTRLGRRVGSRRRDTTSAGRIPVDRATRDLLVEALNRHRPAAAASGAGHAVPE